METEAAARLLGLTAYPQGREWRCVAGCDFSCDDAGPDKCPRCGGALWRTMMGGPLGGRRRAGDTFRELLS